MNYVLSLLLPIVVFASGLTQDTITYERNPITNEPQKVEVITETPVIETKAPQIANSGNTSTGQFGNIDNFSTGMDINSKSFGSEIGVRKSQSIVPITSITSSYFKSISCPFFSCENITTTSGTKSSKDFIASSHQINTNSQFSYGTNGSSGDTSFGIPISINEIGSTSNLTIDLVMNPRVKRFPTSFANLSHIANYSPIGGELKENSVNNILNQSEPIKDPYYEIKNSCVRYVNSLVPEAPLIDAIDYPVNTINPKVGDIIKLQYYNATTTRFIYHVALIEEVTQEGYKISQGNKPKGATSTEFIKKEDDNVIGFLDMTLWREISKLPKDMQDTLKCESNFSHYKQGSIIRGDDGEWGLAQFMKGTWKWLSEMRQSEGLSLLDILNPYDQLEMMQYAWSKNLQSHWSCYKSPDIID